MAQVQRILGRFTPSAFLQERTFCFEAEWKNKVQLYFFLHQRKKILLSSQKQDGDGDIPLARPKMNYNSKKDLQSLFLHRLAWFLLCLDKNSFSKTNNHKLDQEFNSSCQTNQRKRGAFPGIESETSSSLRKNYTTRQNGQTYSESPLWDSQKGNFTLFANLTIDQFHDKQKSEI